jgi:hypothetical protein
MHYAIPPTAALEIGAGNDGHSRRRSMTVQKQVGKKKNLRLKRETLRDLSANTRKGGAAKIKGGGNTKIGMSGTY